MLFWEKKKVFMVISALLCIAVNQEAHYALSLSSACRYTNWMQLPVTESCTPDAVEWAAV